MILSEFLIMMLCLVLLPIMFAGQDRLRIKQDYFFMFFLFQGVVYLLLAPAMDMWGGGVASLDWADNYLQIQALTIGLFLLPLGLAYRFLRKGIRNVVHWADLFHLSEGKTVLFCLFLLLFEVTFVLLALQSDMYFRRITTEKIALVVGRLDMLTLVVLRTHDFVVLPAITLLAILLPAIKLQMTRRVRLLAYATLAILLCSFVIYAIVNSRTLLIFLTMALLFTKLVSEEGDVKRPSLRLALLAVAITYGLIVTSNIRYHELKLANLLVILNPASLITEPTNKWEWAQRLDCVNLTAQMDDSLQKNGYEWGRAWERPLVAAFGPLVGSDLAATYKVEARTTAKTYLMEEHTNIRLKDYPSCMVTDLWGNFWIYGLPLAALLAAAVFVSLRYGLTMSSSPAAFVVSLTAIFYFVTFEKEFVDWLFGWIKLIPAIVLLVLLNPIKEISVQNNSAIPL